MVGAAAAALWVSVGSARAPELGSHDAQKVRVAAVEESKADATLRWPGVLRAADRASLSFPVGARLVSRASGIGDRVEKGEVLARLDAEQLQNGASAANSRRIEVEAALAQAERDAERVRQLADKKAATPQELEQTTALVDTLRASLDAAIAGEREASRLLGDSVLRAPFSGTVTATLAEPGETLSPGDAVVELSGDGDFETEIHLSNRNLLQVSEGQLVRVHAPLAGDEAYAGEVSSVAGAAGERGLFAVVVSVETDVSRALRAGIPVEVELDTRSSGEVSVPLAAVLNPGADRPHVFRVVAGQVELVPIEVETLVGDRVVVRGALEATDEVVVTGHTRLIAGDKVEIQEGRNRP